MISGSKYLSAKILLIPNCIKYHPILGVHELVISIFLWRASVTFLDARHIFEVAYAHDSLQQFIMLLTGAAVANQTNLFKFEPQQRRRCC